MTTDSEQVYASIKRINNFPFYSSKTRNYVDTQLCTIKAFFGRTQHFIIRHKTFADL